MASNLKAILERHVRPRCLPRQGGWVSQKSGEDAREPKHAHRDHAGVLEKHGVVNFQVEHCPSISTM